MQKVQPFIEAIPDTAQQRIIKGLFDSFSKYEVLATLTHPANKIARQHPQLVENLVRVATEFDMEHVSVDGTPLPHGPGA